MQAELILAIIQSILKYGPKAVVTIAASMEDKDPTPEDIKSLFITKNPEDYF